MTNDGYDLTIHGLLRKRTDLMANLESYRDKVSSTANDIRAVDRVLVSLGYDGELDLDQPRKRVLNYIKHEIRRFILDELRASDRALTTRELAARLAAREGKDTGDRKLMRDLSHRVSKSVIILHDKQVVRRSKEKNWREYSYEIAK